MLKDFYQKNQREIANAVRDFVDKDLYGELPELRGACSILVTGSVATNNYDHFSDIDLNILFATDEQVAKFSQSISKYKQHLREIGEPVQIHKPNTYQSIKATLATWQNDSLLREYAQALIVNDPQDQFLAIQQKFAYYPQEIYKEKIQWLFAEMNFQLKDRLEIGVARQDRYFCEIVKMNIVRLFLNTLLLLGHKYPSFDKHLYRDAKMILQEEVKLVDKLIGEKDLPQIQLETQQLKDRIETLLLAAQLIPKETDQYWIDLRPAYQVKLD